MIIGHGPFGGRLFIEMPALTALGHPELAGLLRAGSALIVSRGPARDGDDLHGPGSGVDTAHRQWSHAYSVLFSDCLGNIRAQWQCSPLLAGQLREARLGVTHQAVTSPTVAMARRVTRDTTVPESGSSSAPRPRPVNGTPPNTQTAVPPGSSPVTDRCTQSPQGTRHASTVTSAR